MITSSANQKIKDFRRLRDRKYRTETGLSYIEGIRIVFEAIKQKTEILEVIYSPELSRSTTIDEIINQSNLLHIEITEVSKPVFEYLSNKDGPQGIAAVIRQKWISLEDIKIYDGIWVGLYEIADPGNLGTIMRTCDAVQVKGLILIDNCTDPYDPSAVRGSMGGLFSTRLCKTSSDLFTQWVEKNNVRVIGTSDQAKTDYREIAYPMGMVLLMGSERRGIPEVLLKICKSLVSIPMKGNCDSLNLSVATSIILYEVLTKYEENLEK